MKERFDEVFVDEKCEQTKSLTEGTECLVSNVDAVMPKTSSFKRDHLRKTVHHLFEEQVDRSPEAIALICGTVSITYRELDERANQLAHHLLDMGLQLEEPVAFCLYRSLESTIVSLAILKAGGYYLPLDPASPDERLHLMIEDAGCTLILTRSHFHERFLSTSVRVVDIDELETETVRESRQRPQIEPENLAYVMYTSGSTGKPKGVMIPHHGIVRLVTTQNYVTLNCNHTILQLASLAFDASTFEIWGALLNGARLVVFPDEGFSGQHIGEAIQDYGVTTLWLTAGLFHLMTDHHPEALAPLKQLLAGGEVLSPQHVRKALDCLENGILINGYGPTENTTFTCCHQMERSEDVGETVLIGRGINHTSIYVLDSSMSPVSENEIGELYTGGDGLARGYGNRADLTAERFVPNPFSPCLGDRLYRSGDLVRHLSDGSIDFVGRVDNQIKLRGFRIELGEIEHVLSQCEGVTTAIVLMREDKPGEKRLVAYLTTADKKSFEEYRLREELKDSLPDYMMPARYVFLDSMPLTPGGKVDRKALPQPEKRRPELSVPFELPQTETQRFLCGLWQDLLDLDRVGINDDFTALGGDSLLATRCCHLISEETNLHLRSPDLIKAGSIRALSILLDGLDPGESVSTIHPRGSQFVLPLSTREHHLWLHHQLYPEIPVYNESCCIRLGSEIRPDLMQKALTEMVCRHEILRTTFPERDGTPVQVIGPPHNIDLPVIDLGTHEHAETEMLRMARENLVRSFNVVNGPLWRALMVHLPDGEWRLFMAFHHIILDGYSLFTLFAPELTQIYYALARNHEVSLGKCLQYGDYTCWQQNNRPEEELERQRALWRQRLKDLPVLKLPTDFPRPPGQNFMGDRIRFTIDKQLTDRIHQCAADNGVTFFTVLLAGFLTLLYRYSGMARFPVGIPSAGREQNHTEEILGYFISTMVLKADLDGSPSFSQLLQRTKQELSTTLENQDLPFEELVQLACSNRAMGSNPLVQVAFVLEPHSDPRGWRADQLDLHTGASKFDLTMGLDERPEGILGGLEYRTDLFNKATIERMIGHYCKILEAAITRPSLLVSQIPLLGSDELAIRKKWNETTRFFSRETLDRLFEKQVDRTPEGIALVYGVEQLTWRELDHRANELAHYLLKKGVRPEEPVAFCLHRSFESTIATLAILKAGCFYLPLDPQLPDERCRLMLEDARCSLILTQSCFQEKWSDIPGQIIDLDTLQPEIARESCERTNVTRDARNLAYIMYTSGSTGRPKGVMVTHQGVARLVLAQDYITLNEHETILQLANLSFDASTFEVWGALLNGGRLVVFPDKDFQKLGATIREQGVSTLCLTTALFHLMADNHLPDLTSLRQLLAGGSVLSPTHARKALEQMSQGALINGYGPTENTTITCCHRMEKAAEIHETVPIGKSIQNTTVHVLSSSLVPVPFNVVGELYTGGVGLARGYVGRPDLTAERFIPDPYAAEPGARLYRTGDLVRCLPDGDIDFVGRADNQVKLRGFRIELGEIEHVLLNHESVAETVVILSRDMGEEQLVAYFVARLGENVAIDELRTYLKAQLPDYMIPSRWINLKAMPLNPNGKVDHKALPKPDTLACHTSAKEQTSPRNHLEYRILNVWVQLLGNENIGVHDNFFDVGGNSLLLIRLQTILKEELDLDVPTVDLFRHSSIAALAGHVGRNEKTPSQPYDRTQNPAQIGTTDIAVIGMACRFPGSPDARTFWDHLVRGVEGLRQLEERELLETGIEPELFQRPDYVKTGGFLDDVAGFDASFFGFSPREAERIDPQHRIYLECSWHALEDAAYDPVTYAGKIGVFAACADNHYQGHVGDMRTSVQDYQLMLANSKDFLASRVAYKLSLRGPAITVQTACSSSLVAVHQACNSLRLGECHMALAGGVSLMLPHKAGYLYREGMILSRDGHCRAFDVDANGTAIGNGVGVVVLKPLHLAEADNDCIYAVIRGTAVNNDGSQKAGYTAPSIEGQATVIRMALDHAGFSPASISYIEAHGTGTPMGDPIEVAALNQVFSANILPASCALGSVKTNIGHLNAASGIAGFIKTVLALHHRILPVSLHFKEPNPRIDFQSGPFYVNNQTVAWPEQATSRRAGVSSFGIGGTNAHVVLEEASFEKHTGPASEQPELILLSARSDTAITQVAMQLSWYLESEDTPLSDVAHTLRIGRTAHDCRRFYVSDGRADLIRQLRDVKFGNPVPKIRPKLVFMFSGQGSQYTGMAKQLYATEPFFRHEIDRCLALHNLEKEIRNLLFGSDAVLDTATNLVQPALFVFEYALARLLEHHGLKPDVLIGHSLGEYTAACLAGIFTFEECLALVCHRGSLMQSQTSGAMLAVPLAEQEVLTLMSPDLSLAAVNGPNQCVVSGTSASILHLKDVLEEKGSRSRIISNRAFHSSAMDPIMGPFAEQMESIGFRAPHTPIISCVTGTWLKSEEACSPQYWAEQLRDTVRFAEGLGEILSGPECILLEVGPGNILANLARRHPAVPDKQMVLHTLPPQHRTKNHQIHLLETLGRCWTTGIAINEGRSDSNLRRVPLPGYPFEHKKYWRQTKVVSDISRSEREDRALPSSQQQAMDQWFYQTVWHPVPGNPIRTSSDSSWLLFNHEDQGRSLARALRLKGLQIIEVQPGNRFHVQNEHLIELDIHRPDHYGLLMEKLVAQGTHPQTIIHAWNVTGEKQKSTVDELENRQARSFNSLLFLAQALGSTMTSEPVAITVLCDGLFRIMPTDVVQPEKALMLGPCRVIPREYPGLTCRNLEWAIGSPVDTDLLVGELLAPRSEDHIIAFRNDQRMVPSFEPMHLPSIENKAPNLREKGVYLLTGGLGGQGLVFASWLAETVKARLVLCSRREFPPRVSWDQQLEDLPVDSRQGHQIRSLKRMEESGAELLILRGDVADADQMRGVIRQTLQHFGAIHGVIHGAGVPGGGWIQTKSEETTEAVLAPKVKGTLVLKEALADLSPDFLILGSSLTAITADPGQVDYTAANAFLDAFAQSGVMGPRCQVSSINWDGWKEVGMLSDALNQVEGGIGSLLRRNHDLGLSPQQGIEVLRRVLAAKPCQTVISTRPLNERLEDESCEKGCTTTDKAARELAPSGIEAVICRVFARCLGVDTVRKHDDFFTIGGDSLISIQVVAELSYELSLNLSPHILLKHSTPARLARQLVGKGSKPENAFLVPLGGDMNGVRRPLFLIHPVGGHIFMYRELCQALDPDQPVFGIESRALQREMEHESVEDMAAFYIKQIETVQPEGPYQLGGFSFGGTIAFEMALQIRKAGKQVDLLFLGDTPGQGHMPSKIWHDEDSILEYLLKVGQGEDPSGKHLQGENLFKFFLRKSKDKATWSSLSSDPDKLRRYLKIFIQHCVAMECYRPCHYPGSVTFFKAGEEDHVNTRTPELAWKKYVGECFKLYEVPGNHITMANAPNVKAIADILNRALDTNAKH